VQVPQDPPHVSSPQTAEPQKGVQDVTHCPLLHCWVPGHAPQDPPQPSFPHKRPEHWGTQPAESGVPPESTGTTTSPPLLVSAALPSGWPPDDPSPCVTPPLSCSGDASSPPEPESPADEPIPVFDAPLHPASASAQSESQGGGRIDRSIREAVVRASPAGNRPHPEPR
jgi:hypothetical protein